MSSASCINRAFSQTSIIFRLALPTSSHTLEPPAKFNGSSLESRSLRSTKKLIQRRGEAAAQCHQWYKVPEDFTLAFQERAVAENAGLESTTPPLGVPSLAFEQEAPRNTLSWSPLGQPNAPASSSRSPSITKDAAKSASTVKLVPSSAYLPPLPEPGPGLYIIHVHAFQILIKINGSSLESHSLRSTKKSIQRRGEAAAQCHDLQRPMVKGLRRLYSGLPGQGYNDECQSGKSNAAARSFAVGF